MYNRDYVGALLTQKKEELRGKASQFLDEHPLLVGAGILGAYVLVVGVLPSAVTKNAFERTFVDPDTNLIWESTRKLTTAEKLEMERTMMVQSFGVGQALHNMGLLKR